VAHDFLSDSWFEEVERIRAELDPPLSATLRELVINVSIRGGPQGDRDMHMGGGRFRPGLAEGARTRLHVPYDIARAMLIEGDNRRALEAFMAGQIRIEGDPAALLQLQGSRPGGGVARELAQRIRAATL